MELSKKERGGIGGPKSPPIVRIMGKLKRVLRLINLLTHRQYVTLDTIKNACGIPERTAYRYLRDISEANFPVYFDRHNHAYRLDQPSGAKTDEFNAEETILMLVALKKLIRSLNDDYVHEAEALLKKLVVRQSLPLEEVIDAYRHQLDNLPDAEDYSQLISSMLISAAIRCNKKITITVNSSDAPERDIRIENPALHFKKNWQLVNARCPGSEQADIPQIRKVSILQA